jgi:hypothetical protein
MLGMEPTAKRRGIDSHRTTVEHNLGPAKEPFRQITPGSKQADEWKPTYPRSTKGSVHVRKR